MERKIFYLRVLNYVLAVVCFFFVFFKGIFNVHVINYFNMHNTFIIPLYQISFEKNNDYYLKFLNNQFYRHQQN